MILSLLLLVLMGLTSCGTEEDIEATSSTGRAILAQTSNLSCSITIPQGISDLNGALASACPLIYGASLKSDKKIWSIGYESTCKFVAINESKQIIGSPTNSHVGTCKFYLHKRLESDIEIFLTNVTVTNVAPNLSLTDSTIAEDSGLSVVKVDTDIESDEEGYGVYFLDNAGTTAPKCSDNGALSINADNGEVSFNPSLNYNGVCNVRVLFDDENSVDNTVIDEFQVTVTAVNDAPVVSGSCATTSLNHDIAYNCNTLTVADPELTDTQTWLTDATHTCSWLSVNSSTGEISGTANDDQVGTCVLAVKTNDGTVDSNIYSETITVVNVVPTMNDLTTVQSITEDDPDTTVLLAADVTANEEGFGVYSLDNANATAPKCSDNGAVSIDSSTGAVNFTPSANYFGSCIVRVQFDDENSVDNTVYKEATINVTGINDVPVIDSVCATSVDELAAYTCSGAVTDVENDTITWSLDGTNTCSWAAIDSGTGNVTGTPVQTDVGTCDLVLRADDGTDAVTKSFSVTVNNLVPVITVADTNLDEDSASTEIRAGADVSTTDEGFGTYSLIAASSNDCSTHGSTSINASSGAVTYAPDADYDQACNIRIQFDDGHASNNIGTAEFVVTMNPDPDNAVVSLPAACDTDINEDIVYTCTPNITDVDTGDTHTWSIDNNTCAFISGINATTGVMTGTAHDDQIGACTFTIKATGDQDGLVSSTLTANFSVLNVKPVLSVTTPININQRFDAVPSEYAASAKNVDSTIDVTSTDETHGVFSLGTASNDDCAANMTTYTLDTATGVITLFPNDMYFGTCNIAIDFDDENSTDNVADTLEFAVTFVDEIPPLISYVDSSTPDGNYYLGDDINITVKFNEAVNINVDAGVPRIFLETGAIDRTAFYQSLNGDATEVYFNYTVSDDDLSSDLAVHSSVTFLDLAGSTFEDLSGNTLANFPLPLPSTDLANSLSGRRDIAVDGRLADLDVTGLPSRVSPDLALDATVTSSNATHYQYKLKQVGTANDTCADSVGYSSDITISTKLTDDLIPFIMGGEIRLCIVGITGDGVMTPYAQAFEYVWSKDIKSFARVDFTGVNDLPNWQDAEIDPDNNNIIYARNLLGVVYRSEDFGNTWENYCKVPQTYGTNLMISPGPDRTPYVTQNNALYKVTNKLGGDCDNLTSGMNVFKTSYVNTSVNITNTGDIYLTTNKDGSPLRLYRSFDQGATWYLYLSMPEATGTNPTDSTHTLVVNPFDPTQVIYEKNSGTSDSDRGGYLTHDAGATWSYVFYSGYDTLMWNPVNSNIVYRMSHPFERISTDGGLTWTNTGSGTGYLEGDGIQRAAIDYKTGYGYRLRETASNTLLERATDITTAGTFTWSTIYTFSSTEGLAGNSRNISVSGNESNLAEPTIVVNILDRMWISTDGGSTFTEKFAPEELQLMTIAGAGDDHIYGATKDWRVVKTADNGGSWSYKTGDYYHCLGVAPRLMVNKLNPSKLLMWADNFASINCNTFNYSLNGMNSLRERDDVSMDAPKLVVSTSVHDEKTFYVSGDPVGSDTDFRFYQSYNYGSDSTIDYMAGAQFSDPMPDSYIHPHSIQYTWIVDNTGSGVFYEYNLSEGTRTDITSNTALTSIAAIDVYTGEKGQFYLRAMDRAGRMQVSTDYGATFTNEGTTGAPLTSCNKRFLYHHPKDRNLVVTSCVLGNSIGVSLDAGNTWDETDLLADYDIDCKITGVGVSSSRIYIACRDNDTYIFNYAFIKLENDIADSVLSTSETASGLDLVSHYFPGNYNNLEYAVIAAGATCDSGVTFSTTVPTSSDAAFTTRGEYRVCIKQTDIASNVSYMTTSTIFYDNSTPSFTSIDLINEAADGEINLVDFTKDSLIVGNLVSSEHDFVRYAVTLSSNTCDGNLDYSYSIPKANSFGFQEAGTYKVCVELSTRGGVTPVYGASSNITFNKNLPIATLSGLPEAFTSTDSALNITVAGTGVNQYIYKVKASTDTNPLCTDDADYSAPVAVGTPITDSLTGFSQGDWLRLCVRGINAGGYIQSARQATVHLWRYSTTRDFYPIDMSSIGDAETLSNWRQVKVHPNDENILYGLNTIGQIYKSVDKGANWSIQCSIPQYITSMNLSISPSVEAQAFVSHSYSVGKNWTSKVWEIVGNTGLSCPTIANNFRDKVRTGQLQSPLSFNKGGQVFLTENQYDGIVIRKTNDEGRTWQFVGRLDDAGVDARVSIDPFNESNLLVHALNNNSYAPTVKGLYRSTDFGETWTFIQSAGFTNETLIFFDPIVSGRVYSSSGYVSTDSGATWSYNASLDTSGVNYQVDSAGNGYKLVQSGADTILQKSSSMNPINFTTLYTFTGVQSTTHINDQISVTGNTIAVVLENNRLFISTDGGSSFTEKFWDGVSMPLLGLDATHGGQIYSVTKGNALFRTTHLSDNWTMLHSLGTECENEERVISSPLSRDHTVHYYDNCRIKGWATTDAFSTRNPFNFDTSMREGYIMLGAKNPSQLSFFDSSGGPTFYETFNFGASLANTSETNYNQWGSGYINSDGYTGYSLKSNPNRYFVINISNELLIAMPGEETFYSNITSRLPETTAAGLALEVLDGGLSVNHIVASTKGSLSRTTDDGASFTSIVTNNFEACGERIFHISPTNPDLMVMGCHESSQINWSIDAGSTWSSFDTEIDYGFWCGLSSVAMTNSEILFNCEGSRLFALSYSYTPVRLIASAADNIIQSSEASGVAIAEIDHPEDWVSIQYAIINNGASCSGATTGFSGSQPLDTDLTGFGSGDYQICVALNDGSTTTYNTSTKISYLASTPVFTSIDLVNEAVNGLSYAEHVETSSNIVGNLSGGNYTSAYYALVGYAVTCDATLNYSTSEPKNNAKEFDAEGDYKVCVGLSDGVNDPVFAQSASFSFSKQSRIATLSGLPDKISNETTLNITVGGTDITHYQYKVGIAPLNCADSSGYSGSISIGTLITDDISALSDGDIDLCVRGLDNTNNYDQLLASATSYRWTKADIKVSPAKFNIAGFAANWFDVEVSKWDASTPYIYARDFDGNIFISKDRGASFNLACTLPHDANSRMMIAPVKGKGAFATSGTNIYRIDELNGENCKNITSTFTSVVTTWQRAPIAFRNNGDMYAVDEVSGSQSLLYRSNSLGEDWTLIHTFDETFTNLSISVDPFDNDNMIGIYEGTSTNYSSNYILSYDAGVNFVRRASITPWQNPENYLQFDPVSRGYIYGNNGRYSSSAGYRTNNGVGTYVDDLSRWDMDKLGVGYRLIQNGADLEIHSSADMSNASFTLLDTFSNVTADIYNRTVSVSYDGSTKAVLANGVMYISLDSGAFTPTYTPIVRHDISSVSAEDNNIMYAVDSAWRFIKSTDAGATWSFVNEYAAGCSKLPRIRTNKSDNNYVYVWAEQTGSGSCETGIRTSDGFNTQATTNLSWSGSTEALLLLDPVAPLNAAVTGNTTVKNSSSGFSSHTATGLNSMDISGHGYDGFISKDDNTLMYYVSGGSLIEINTIAGSKTDISGGLSSTASGIEALADGSVYIISNTGGLDYSTNSAASFSSYAANPALTSCSSRLLKTSASEAGSVFATACQNSNTVAYSLDSGTTWSEYNLGSYSYTTGCTIRDIAITGTSGNYKLYLACRNSQAITIEME